MAPPIQSFNLQKVSPVLSYLSFLNLSAPSSYPLHPHPCRQGFNFCQFQPTTILQHTADEQREVAVVEGRSRQQEAVAIARLVHALFTRRVHIHKSAPLAARAIAEVPMDHALAITQPVLGPHHARALAA